MEFEEEVKSFIRLAGKENLRMLMVSGGAVNFHGYRRHSADVDFWIDTSSQNLKKLMTALKAIGYDINELPEKVRQGDQNVSINISPSQEIELLTRFNPGKTFDEAWKASVQAQLLSDEELTYRVLNLEDLLSSKQKSARPKDLLDIHELKNLSSINSLGFRPLRNCEFRLQVRPV